MTRIRLAAAVAAAAVSTGALAACGGDNVPGDSVVRVGDSTIKNATFNHWMTVAAISAQGQSQTGKKPAVTIPKPPDFKECIANKVKTAPKPAKGQPEPTTAQFKQQCKQEYEGLRDQVLQFLISAQWIANEAKEQDIEVTDKEVRKQFEQAKKQSFPKEADFERYLAASGATVEDLRFSVRGDLTFRKLREKVTKGKDNVTKAQIAEYYDKNKARFAQPERRDLRIVLTKTQARAQAAKSALAGGGSWKTVAKQYSIDQASKNQGGVLLAVAKGQQEKSLDDAVFKAKTKALVGPVKTQFGYYVFQVQKVTEASQQTLAQATPTIKQLLASQNQQKALDKFVKDFQKHWKDETTCREGFVIQDCHNASKPKAATTTTPATTTGGGYGG